MVIKTDYPLLADGLERVEYSSDSECFIRKVGTDELYDRAVELSNVAVEYEETDVLIENIATDYDYINALESLGVSFDE